MYRIVEPVTIEPMTVADVREHLRLADLIEADLITGLIQSAREYCENYTRCAFATQTLELLLYRFPSTRIIYLPAPPLQEVLSIKTIDSSGSETTLLPGSYVVDTEGEIGRVILNTNENWPAFEPYPNWPVRIRFKAGFVSLPQSLKQAMLLLIGHWYENREATGTASGSVAFSVHALLSMFRVGVF